MAGLLDLMNNPQMQLGLGLLAAASARGDGAGFGQRLSEGFKSAQEAQRATALQKLQDMQMSEAQRKIDEAARQRKWREGLPGVVNQKVYGSSDVGPTMEQDTNALNNYLMQADSPYADKVLEQKLFAKPEAYTLGEGQTRYVGNQVVARGPEKTESVDSKIKQFEYAKANGYKGSFQEFVTLGPTIMAGAVAPLRNAQIENIQRENDYNLPKPKPMASSPYTVTTPDGQVFSFPDQKSANNFKMNLPRGR